MLAVRCLLLVALVGGAACSREPAFADRTARVTVDGETTSYDIDGCGLDGTTVFVLGRTDEGEVLQAVVGVEPDGETGVPTSTGISVTDGAVPVTAFGDEAWDRRGETGEAPGQITEARVRGARIQASGQAQPADVTGRPTSGAPVPLSLDARCDERDG